MTLITSPNRQLKLTAIDNVILSFCQQNTGFKTFLHSLTFFNLAETPIDLEISL
jgi:hypothetical protein